MSKADAKLAAAAIALTETDAFKAQIDAVTALYNPARQDENLHDALRCILVTMKALGPKAATALNDANTAIAEAAAAAAVNA
jgi:hypothetical protein